MELKSGFAVLERMCDNNNPKMQMVDAGTNLIDLRENNGLREGWGSITLAIKSETAKELLDSAIGLNNGEYFCGLFIYPMNEYWKTLKELKAE